MLGFSWEAVHEEAIKKGLLPKRQLPGTGIPDIVSSLTSVLPGIGGGGSTTAAPTSQPTSPNTVLSPTTVPTANTIPQQSSTGAPRPPATTSIPTSDTPAETPVETPTPSSSTPSSTPARTSSAAPNSSAAPTSATSDIVVIGSATINRSTLTAPTVISSPLVAVSTEPVVYVTDYTSNGQTLRTTVTSSRLHTSTTGYTASTIQPALIGGGNGSGGGNGGLSEGSKKTIGGVVGGVGGAIFIGALAILFWRLHAKKKRNQLYDGHEDFHDSATSGSNGRSKSPFNRYRSSPTPNAPLTAASNF